MSDRRPLRRTRSVRITGLLAAVLVAVAACSVPSQSKPIVDSPLETGISQSGTGGPPPPPSPDSFYRDEAAFVVNGYMTAMTSQVSAKLQVNAARAFMTPDIHWTPPPNPNKASALPVTVVREVGDPVTHSTLDGNTKVTINVDVIGVFDPVAGELSSQAGRADPTVLTFIVSPADSGTGFRLTSAPPGLYMFSSALYNQHSYTPQPIYFWTPDGRLVPDLRYLATWLSPQQEATAIVTWILNGPPAWMGSMKQVVPAGVGLADSAITVDKAKSAFIVNLTTTPLSPEQQNDFMVQVRWSLGATNVFGIDTSPDPQQTVELQIQNRPVNTDSSADYLSQNPAVARDSSPIAYAVVGGKVQAVGYVPASSTVGTVVPYDKTNTPEQPKVFDDPTNTNVLLGAVHITPQQSDVVLVKQNSGQQELWVTRTNSGDTPKYTRVKMGFTVKSFSRPVWLNQLPGAFAVIADGKLYVVAGPKGVVEPVGTNVDEITGFSIASDGYRIAYISAGQVWIAMLTASGQPSMSTATPINLRPSLDTVDSVAWSSIYQLVVAGTAGSTGYAIETNCDGVDDIDPYLSDVGFAIPEIPQIASYPVTPLRTVTPPVMIQTATGAESGRAHLIPFSTAKPPQVNYPFFGE